MTLSGEVPLDQRIQLVDSFQGEFIQVLFVIVLQYWFHEINNKTLAVNQQKWGQGVANQAQIFNAGFVKTTLCNSFSYISINVFNWRYQFYSRKEIYNLFYFYATVQGRVVGRVRNKTSFVSLRSRFGGSNKNFKQKKEEQILYM